MFLFYILSYLNYGDKKMMYRFRLLLIFGLLGIYFLSYFEQKLLADDALLSKVTLIVEESLKTIKKIHQGDLNLYFSTTNETNPALSYQKTLHIIFDGKKMLVRHDTERTAVYAFDCYPQSSLIYFTTSPANIVGTPPPVNLNIQDFHLDSLKVFPYDHLTILKRTLDTQEFSIPTPVTLRQIGQTACSIEGLERRNLENIFAVFKKRARKYWRNTEEESLQSDYGGFYNLQLMEEKIDDYLCYKISWNFVGSLITDRIVTDENGRELTGKEKIEYLRSERSKGWRTCWFDKMRGNLIRKMITHSEDANANLHGSLKQAGISPMVSTITNELSQDKQSQLWYPSKWRYVQTRGDKLYEHEEGSMEYNSINQPIPPEYFSLENINELKPDCPVEWNLNSVPPGKGKLIWDGKKIVGLEVDTDSHAAKLKNRRTIFIILANILIISGIILIQIFRRWNHRRK
jgi:hypothetical protein